MVAQPNFQYLKHNKNTFPKLNTSNIFKLHFQQLDIQNNQDVFVDYYENSNILGGTSPNQFQKSGLMPERRVHHFGRAHFVWCFEFCSNPMFSLCNRITSAFLLPQGALGDHTMAW